MSLHCGSVDRQRPEALQNVPAPANTQAMTADSPPRAGTFAFRRHGHVEVEWLGSDAGNRTLCSPAERRTSVPSSSFTLGIAPAFTS